MPGKPAIVLFPLLKIFDIMVKTVTGIAVDEDPCESLIQFIADGGAAPFAGGIEPGSHPLARQMWTIGSFPAGILDTHSVIGG